MAFYCRGGGQGGVRGSRGSGGRIICCQQSTRWKGVKKIDCQVTAYEGVGEGGGKIKNGHIRNGHG